MPTLKPDQTMHWPPLGGVPVGTILPYVAPADESYLTPSWRICDGTDIDDVESPFHGKKLPLLTDNRYLVGVDEAAQANEPVDPSIPDDGVHAHGGGWTEKVNGHPNADGRQVAKDDNGAYTLTGLDHQHIIDSDGKHHHPGEVKPKSLTVYYIMRIK
jgi:hypothetical protein